ncbi:hypothetical protein [Caulobacter sp. LjRoot300]|uniref:hypothetical protein n=1 Tax=Caulobacter sp. LjRoot300 TaxID=3342321 RepID=UPI003ECE59B5
MSGKDSEDKQRSKLLSRALRAVRAVRNVKPRALAGALGLSLRGYQHFEAGGGQLNIDHVMAFAQASDADPIGILTAVQIGKPEFAAWVAQNKAMIAFMITLQEFTEDTGEAMARLETTTWVSAYREMFKGLSEKALAAQALNDAWLAENAARLGLGTARPGAQDRTGGAEADDDETADAKGDLQDDPEPPDEGGS